MNNNWGLADEISYQAWRVVNGLWRRLEPALGPIARNLANLKRGQR